MSKHTPGPWEADFETYPIMVCSQSETWPLVDELGNEEERAGVFVANTGDNKANARLIAAAPDLLEMLVEAANFIQPYSVGQELLERIDAAIAKATGGQA
jgi:hypothetical protein